MQVSGINTEIRFEFGLHSRSQAAAGCLVTNSLAQWRRHPSFVGSSFLQQQETMWLVAAAQYSVWLLPPQSAIMPRSPKQSSCSRSRVDSVACKQSSTKKPAIQKRNRTPSMRVAATAAVAPASTSPERKSNPTEPVPGADAISLLSLQPHPEGGYYRRT